LFDGNFARLIATVVITIYIVLTSKKIQNVDILVPVNPGSLHLENGCYISGKRESYATKNVTGVDR